MSINVLLLSILDDTIGNKEYDGTLAIGDRHHMYSINEIYFMMDETYKPELRFSEGGVRDSLETSYNRNVYCAITMGEMKPNRCDCGVVEFHCKS